MRDLNYVHGDLFQLANNGIIAHVCNNIGLFGAGFALAVTNHFPDARVAYLDKFKSGLTLGETIFCSSGNFLIANMIAQNGVRGRVNKHPISYSALEYCLDEVQTKAKELGTTIHMPKIGSGFAGGNWQTIEILIKRTALVDTYIYFLD